MKATISSCIFSLSIQQITFSFAKGEWLRTNHIRPAFLAFLAFLRLIVEASWYIYVVNPVDNECRPLHWHVNIQCKQYEAISRLLYE
jgi:hypothetical protein